MPDSAERLSALPARRTGDLGVVCEEPFRIFFPAGVFLDVTGVLLWLLFYSGFGIPYPSVGHARLMIEGFMASFIFGFLGTAGPRLTSAPHFSLHELGAIFTLDLVAAGFHLGGADRLGDICFLLCLLVFAGALAKRFRQRKDSPPANFVLVALGLGSGIAGAALVAYAETAHRQRRHGIRGARWDRPSRRATPFRGSPSIPRTTRDWRCSRCGGIQTRAPL